MSGRTRVDFTGVTKPIQYAASSAVVTGAMRKKRGILSNAFAYSLSMSAYSRGSGPPTSKVRFTSSGRSAAPTR